MISVEAALAAVLDLAGQPGTETVPLRQAAGRVLAAPVTAGRDQPPFAAAAMDGYAIAAADHRPGAVLDVTGVAAAGRGGDARVAPGSAVRVFTGAPVPPGADRVVLQEDVTRDGDRITLGARLEEASHVRPAGADFRAGDSLAPPRRLTPRDLALIAAMGAAQVTVARRPVVAFLPTGDELVMPGETPGPDQIVSSNPFALAAMAEAEGAEARLLPIARDTADSLRFALGLAAGADLVVTIGGASVGEHDLVAAVAGGMGLDLAFHRIAMRPGKPLMAGRMAGSAMLGLPGNPVSAIVCGHLFMLPLIRAMQGLPKAPAPRIRAALAAPVPANGPRTHFMRARLEPGDGLPAIRPFALQDSALLGILSQADALLVRPANDPARPAGHVVEGIPL
ncbi:MAG: molybdopterin molybdotransferase MoeA [Rhodobacteraceae bacterium]|nr:molybdopterin molybdotransferase MoeA [Paracoccaceae bacterium]